MLLPLCIGYNWNGPRPHLGPWLFWAPGNLVPEKFGPQEIWPVKLGPQENWSPRKLVPAWKSLWGIFIHGPNFLGTKFLGGPNFLGPKFLGGQISEGPNFSGTKKGRGLNEIGDHFSYSLCITFLLPIEQWMLFSTDIKVRKQNELRRVQNNLQVFCKKTIFYTNCELSYDE